MTSLQQAQLVESQNGGQPKVAYFVAEAFDGDGGWRIEGRRDLLTRAQFSGNYKPVKDNEKVRSRWP